jgi:hypothetical protein
MANIQSIITNGNGNVLIGTTTDSGFKLDVNGVGRFSSGVQVPNGQYFQAIRNSGALLINLLGIDAGTDNTRLLITGDFDIRNGSLTSLMNMTANGATTFSSSVTATTFLGDLNGTINTLTTGTTQTAGNNSTLIATTAYADAAAAAVPIGNYLPLTAGSGYPLTGDLYITKAATPLIQLTDTTNSKTLLLGVDDANAFIRTGAGENFYLQVNGGTNAITILNDSNVGIGTTNPSFKLDVGGVANASGGIVANGENFEKYLGAKSFADGVANRAINVQFGDFSLGGRFEITITGTYSNANAGGGITKVFSVLTNPSNNIYTNESRVTTAIGPIVSNFAIGELQWDSGSSQYIIPISHIVSSGNPVYVHIKVFGIGSTANVYSNVSLSDPYTLTALSRNYEYYNNNVGIGTDSPTVQLQVNGNFRLYTTNNDSNELRGAFNVGGTADPLQFSMYKADATTVGTFLTADGVSYFAGGNVGIGTTAPLTTLSVFKTVAFSTSSPQAGEDNIFLTSATAAGSGVFGGSIGFSRNGFHDRRAAAIASVQGTADEDQIGLAFFTHPTIGGADAIAEAMRISYDGNVGIGTTAPPVKLRVQSSGSTFTTPDNNDVATISIYNSNNSSATAHAIISMRTQVSGGSPFISFDVENEAGYSVGMDNASNQFRIAYGWNSLTAHPGLVLTQATSPNVLIGTTTDAGYKLDVSGTLRVTGAATFSSSVTAERIQINSTTYEPLAINSSYGQVGLKFGLNGTYFAAMGSASNVTTAYTGSETDLGLGTSGSSTANIIFVTGAGLTRRMTITSAGNVGIGTNDNAPYSELQVQAAANTRLLLQVVGTEAANDNAGLFFKSAIHYTNSYIKGALLFSNAGVGNGVGDLIMATNNDANSTNVSLADARLIVKAGGNVLIGTTTDSGFKLRVNGEILADDDIRIFNTFALSA